MENSKRSFKDIVNKNNGLNKESDRNGMLKGWVYFNKNELNKKYKKEDLKKSKKRKEETTKEILNFYKKLSIRWNRYRDEINDLIGDISPFINYKDDIKKTVQEENMILEEIYNESKCYMSSSDDDLFYLK
tara:strand:+ start:4701 stop:5093 length:393 start_codon:yes stop_codon:yes gene_type:complete